jgi:hypothetical protein
MFRYSQVIHVPGSSCKGQQRYFTLNKIIIDFGGCAVQIGHMKVAGSKPRLEQVYLSAWLCCSEIVEAFCGWFHVHELLPSV